MLCISFAVSAHAGNFEDIAGFKIGSKIEANKNITKIPEGSISGYHSASFYASRDIMFFDNVLIGVNKNEEIECLVFFKTYDINSMGDIRVDKIQIKNDFHTIYNQISNRFGKFDISNGKDMFSKLLSESNSLYMGKLNQHVKNLTPTSKYIGAIGLTLEGKGLDLLGGGKISLVLNYWSPAYLKAEVEKKKSEVSGF
jgi:hypothetical protein